MLKFVKTSVAALALLGVGLISPAMAQSASEMAVRMQQLEEQVGCSPARCRNSPSR